MSTVIESFFACLQSGNLEGALALASRDAQFIAARPGTDPHPDMMYGTYRGHDGVREFVVKLGRLFEPQLFAIDRAAAIGTLEVAEGRLCHRVRATGRLFASDWAVTCTVEEGRIRRYHFFEDTAALEAAMQQGGQV